MACVSVLGGVAWVGGDDGCDSDVGVVDSSFVGGEGSAVVVVVVVVGVRVGEEEGGEDGESITVGEEGEDVEGAVSC